MMGRRTHLGPHLGGDDRHVLMPHLHRSGDKLRVDDMFPEQDEGVARSGDMFRVGLTR
jgi:hypothetical protein